jgi:hypothetical protein
LGEDAISWNLHASAGLTKMLGAQVGSGGEGENPGSPVIMADTGLADDAGVSRKFVYQQADRAQSALEDAFAPTVADDQVLFYLPVTKNWLHQAALGLTLICHSSYRGVCEFYRDLLGVNLSVGTVHNNRPRRHRQGTSP